MSYGTSTKSLYINGSKINGALTIPNSVTSIGDYAFGSCTCLSNIYYAGTKEQWNAINKGEDWNYGVGNYTDGYTIHYQDEDI